MKKFIPILLLALLPSFLLAQRLQKVEPSKSALKIDHAEKSGSTFHKTTVFRQLDERESSKITEDLISVDYKTFKFTEAFEVKNLQSSFSLTIPNENKEAIELKLVEANILSSSFKVATDQNKNGVSDLTLGKHYQGIINGEESSFAAISIYEDGVQGVIYSTEGKRIITKIHSNKVKGAHLTYLENNLNNGDKKYTCYTPDDDYVYSQAELENLVSSRSAGDCVDIYIEVDKDIHDGKGGVQGATNYVTALFNQSALLYSNESITIRISEIFIHTSGKPYKGRDASRLLSEFQSKHGSSGSWNGDLAHLVSYKGGGGIAAGFSGICNSDRRNSMCMSGIDPSFNNIPSWSWSVSVFTHEMGHLFGSRHTHACVWNGNGTAIDGCYNVEGTCSKPAIPSGGGTVMSYCHLTSVGINFNSGFGPQPGNVIRNTVASASCLSSCDGGGSTCNNGVQDGDETGMDCGGSCIACATCSDGIQNGSETGIDCGGPDCAACPPVSCNTPDGLFATNIKGTRAQMKWTAVTGATGYTVQVRNAGGAWQDFPIGSNSLNLRGFSNGTTYEWRVQATCTSGSSDYSIICSFVAGDKNSGACSSAGLIKGTNNTLVNVFPNPSYGEISIEFVTPLLEDGLIYLYDISGKQLLRQDVEKNTTIKTISTHSIVPGLYIFKIEGSESTQIIKHVVR